ncbi:hypothetical protein ADK37_37365 [Streptomyces resistomycificus]|uniref:Uncharacterized protein n=1 Tax=Streptomyces resistomycificus TaxID=67356 RepID=A0A0L8KU31_9ACTN|nr:hypothetical protein ADK37_37365 [Streptomyces resistomycificus]
MRCRVAANSTGSTYGGLGFDMDRFPSEGGDGQSLRGRPGRQRVPRSCERSDPDSFEVGLLGIRLSSREAELDLLPLTPASAEPPYVAVRAAVPYVAGTDRD